MKKTLKLMGLCALAVLVLAGCKKNEQNGNMTFKATISQLNNNAKTEIGSGNWLVWNTGDQIKVYTADKTETNAANFTLATGAGTKDATFSGTLTESDTYYAFYPTTGIELTGEGKFKLPVSDTQTFVDANFTTNTFPMCATATDGDLEFHSPYGILGIPMKGTATIGSIVLTDSLGMLLEGYYEMNDVDTTFVGNSATITLSFGEGLTLSADTAKTAYFIVPAGVFTMGFKAEVKGTDGNRITMLETSKNNVIVKEYIRLMPEVTGVDAPAPAPAYPTGSVKGLYSVRPNFKVYFSMGNLQYQPSTDTWRFAENPWDFVGGSYTMVDPNITCGNMPGNTNNSYYETTYEGWMDLFSWGTGDNPTNYSSDDAQYYIYNEWGANPISNGGNTPTQWRTLAGGDNEGSSHYSGDGTYGEWKYLLYERDASTVNGVANARFAKATVNGVAGLIIFADIYTHPAGIVQPVNINTSACLYTGNNYTAAEWAEITEAGAAFLPAASFRYWYDVYGYPYYLRHWEIGSNVRGYYWASYGQSGSGISPFPTNILFAAETTSAYYNTVSAVDGCNNNNALSVRLVRDYEGNGGGTGGGGNPGAGLNGMQTGSPHGW